MQACEEARGISPSDVGITGICELAASNKGAENQTWVLWMSIIRSSLLSHLFGPLLLTLNAFSLNTECRENSRVRKDFAEILEHGVSRKGSSLQ